MGFGGAVATCLRKYITFSGRATRTEYWCFTIFCVGLGWGAYIADYASGTGILIQGILATFVFLPFFAVSSRRLQDTGFPGYLVFTPLVAIPIFLIAFVFNQTFAFDLAWAVGAAIACVILVLKLFPSEPKPNAYGVHPYWWRNPVS